MNRKSLTSEISIREPYCWECCEVGTAKINVSISLDCSSRLDFYYPLSRSVFIFYYASRKEELNKSPISWPSSIITEISPWNIEFSILACLRFTFFFFFIDTFTFRRFDASPLVIGAVSHALNWNWISWISFDGEMSVSVAERKKNSSIFHVTMEIR